MRARILLVVCLLLMVGLSVAGWYIYREYLSEKQITFQLKVDSYPGVEALELELLSDGQPLGPLPLDRKVELPSRKFRRFSLHAIPELGARVRLPCGWREMTIKVTKAPTLEEFREARKSGEALLVVVRLEYTGAEPATFDLFVDNRGGPAARLAVGQMTVTLPANKAEEIGLAAPDCPEGTTVRLNEQEIGSVPVLEPDPNRQVGYYSLGTPEDMIEKDQAVVFFLDTTGQRCYRLTEKNYSPPGVTPFGGFWAGPSDPVYLRRKFLYRLPPTQIEYFMEKAPEQITVNYTADYKPDLEMRNEFVEVPCR